MKVRSKLIILLLTLTLIVAFSGIIRAAEKFPDNRPTDWLSNWGKWGPDDGIGTLNYITPEVTKSAAKMIKQGKIISLAMNATPGVSPVWPGRKGLQRFMAADGADFMVNRAFGNLAATESTIMIEDHGSTHMDPLVHVWWGNYTYNGYKAEEVISRFLGVTKGGTNGYINRGFTKAVFLDVAKYLGVDYVEKIGDSNVITPELLDKVAAAEGVTITPGSAVLIRTGWMKKWTGAKTPWAIGSSHVGISCGIEQWLQDKQVSLVGTDNVAVEAIPASKECKDKYKVVLIPMHVGVLSMMGLPFMELMDLDALSADSAKDGVYEFAFSFAPFKYMNASGGLVSPIAIK